MTPALLDTEGAADLLGVSRRYLQQMDRSGRLGPQSIRLGRCARWSRAELEAWAAAGCPPRREWAEIAHRCMEPVTATLRGRDSQGFGNGSRNLSAGLSG